MDPATPSPDVPAPLPTRALTALSTHLSTELVLLARIHYKNQSQHRLALFWRRVNEIKRLGGKVQTGWLGWQTRAKELVDQAASKGSHVELRRLGSLLENLHLALPKLHDSLHQLVLLTHFLPLVTVLLGMTARLWGISAAMYDHLRGVWAREYPDKRPWRRLDGAEVASKLFEAASAPAELASVFVSDTPTTSQRTSPVPARHQPPPEHGEVIQRRPPPPPAPSAALGTVVTREPIARPPPPPPSYPLDEEPITYADSDSDPDSDPAPIVKLATSAQPSPPPPQPIHPAPSTFLPFLSAPTSIAPSPQSKPKPTPMLAPTLASSPKPPKRPSPALPPSSSAPAAKRLKVVDEKRVKPSLSSTADELVVKKLKVKKKKRDELDDIFG